MSSRLPDHLEEYVLEFVGLPNLLFSSCQSGCVQLVRQLIAYSKMNRYLARCPLHLHQSFVVACLHGSVDIARLLLLNFRISNTCLEYALREAAALNRVDIVRLILSSSNPDTGLITRTLQSACFMGSRAVVNAILRKGVLFLNELPANLLPLACLTGCNELVRLLLASSSCAGVGSYDHDYEREVDTLISDPRLPRSSLTQALQIARQAGYAELSAVLFAAISDAQWISAGIRSKHDSIRSFSE